MRDGGKYDEREWSKKESTMDLASILGGTDFLAFMQTG